MTQGMARNGNLIGPASSTDNAIARFDSTTGTVLQNSGVTIDDSGNVTLPASTEIANTVWTNWTPTITLGGSLTKSSATITKARYNVLGKRFFFSLDVVVVLNGGTGGTIAFTTPVGFNASYTQGGSGLLYWAGLATNSVCWWISGGGAGTIQFGKYDGGNLTVASTEIIVTGFYEL